MDPGEHTMPQKPMEENFKKRMVNNLYPEREQSEISTKMCPLNVEQPWQQQIQLAGYDYVDGRMNKRCEHVYGTVKYCHFFGSLSYKAEEKDQENPLKKIKDEWKKQDVKTKDK